MGHPGRSSLWVDDTHDSNAEAKTEQPVSAARSRTLNMALSPKTDGSGTDVVTLAANHESSRGTLETMPTGQDEAKVIARQLNSALVRLGAMLVTGSYLGAYVAQRERRRRHEPLLESQAARHGTRSGPRLGIS